MPKTKKATSSRLYYSISEVCKLTQIKPHVLRYWESEFKELNPQKNRAGNRVYKKGDIKTILKIKRLLYDERYTIEGAKKQLEEDEDRRTKEERLTEEIIRLKTTLSSIRADLIDLTNILSGG